MRRLLGATAFSFLILVIAVTPLSATTQRGYFDLWLPAVSPGPAPHVVLFDDTGLVNAFLPTVSSDFSTGLEPGTGVTTRFQFAWIGGCSDALIVIHFYPSGTGYGLDASVRGSSGCGSYVGIDRGFTVLTTAPIDVSTVLFRGPNFLSH